MLIGKSISAAHKPQWRYERAQGQLGVPAITSLSNLVAHVLVPGESHGAIELQPLGQRAGVLNTRLILRGSSAEAARFQELADAVTKLAGQESMHAHPFRPPSGGRGGCATRQRRAIALQPHG